MRGEDDIGSYHKVPVTYTQVPNPGPVTCLLASLIWLPAFMTTLLACLPLCLPFCLPILLNGLSTLPAYLLFCLLTFAHRLVYLICFACLDDLPASMNTLSACLPDYIVCLPTYLPCLPACPPRLAA